MDAHRLETDAVLELLKHVATEYITPRFRKLGDDEVMEKNPGDLVTIADREAEKAVTDWLHSHDPEALVVGEEATAADPTLLNKLAHAPRAWIIDPVDGTKNFVNGRKEHAVMLAELAHGETVRGWIWQPELGHAYVAEKGAGLYLDNARLNPIPRSNNPAELRILTSNPVKEGPSGDLTLYSSAWCCGVDYPWLANGTADAIVYWSDKPWDHAPGSLFIRELGGVIRYADGTEYHAGRQHTSRLIPAATAHIWEIVTTEGAALFH
ncbi:Inositol-1-monophosphatase [Dermatophilus congolensis]|uniref:Inositol-1-monophosphatase n=1 Tax=Dermatophilus congolensis TaxID=1863 RepID=A0AA46BPT2_9MICO|nr:inositol monophosphatase family protein [Dermatophilus congolensis]STD13804.1 Inositol-1-monophosphatase [Dermatophilus congolensis]